MARRTAPQPPTGGPAAPASRDAAAPVVAARRPGIGVSLVLTGATLFIVNAGVSRVAMRAGVDPLALTTVRLTGTAVALALLASLFHRAALRPPRGRLAWLLVLHGVVGVAALQWTYNVAIDRLPLGMALLLEYQAPILVAVWARVVQKEQVRPRAWVGLVMATVGLGLATGILQGLKFDSLGILAGLGAAVSFATYFLVGEHGVASLDPLRVILWSFLVATVALNLVSPITSLDTSLLDQPASLLGRLASYDVPVWTTLLWVILLGTLVPFGVELMALRHLRATTVTMIAMLEPVGVALLGWVWFYESLGLAGVVGGALVVTGIVLAQTARRAPVLVEPPHL